MTEAALREWMKQFGHGRSEENPVKVMRLFFEKLEYFESSFNFPYLSYIKVVKLRELFPNN